MQVGETAVDQRAHEVHRQRRTHMRFQQALRVGRTRRQGELRRVDDIAAVRRQRHPGAGLGIRGARLGVLAGEAADAGDALAQPMRQYQRHLQQHLEPVGDDFGPAVGKRFGTVAALQHEALASLGFGQLLLETFDLPGRHQRRQLAQLRQRGVERGAVGILRLLHRRARLPGLRQPEVLLRSVHLRLDTKNGARV